MDKLKSVFSPGSKEDDSVLYGDGNSSNLGKVTGEGTHFGHSRTTDPSESSSPSARGTAENATIDASKAATSNTPTSSTATEPTEQTPSSDATKAAQLASKQQPQETQEISSYDDPDQKGTNADFAASRADAGHQKDTPSGATGSSDQTRSGLPIDNEFALSPNSTSGQPQSQTGTTAPNSTSYSSPYSTHSIDPRVDPSASHTQKEHQVGRDFPLGGATAGAAAYEGDKLQEHGRPADQPLNQPGELAPVSDAPNVGTSSSVVAKEPQISSDKEPPPASTGTTQTSYDPDTSNPTYLVKDTPQPTHPEQHHYGRDAALGAEAGTTTTGGYEAVKEHGKEAHSSATHPTSQTQPSGATPAVYDSQRVQQPATGAGYYTAPHGTVVDNDKQADHHYGRDAAIGTGVGAAGAGGYEALKHHEGKSQPPTETAVSQPPVSTEAGVPGQAITTDTRQPVATAKEQKPDDHHYGRDAAIDSGAAGAGGIAAYEAKKHEDERKALEQQQKAEEERQKQTAAEEKAKEKEEKKAEKAEAKEQKKAEKEHEKAVKQYEKEVKKEEKQHEKEVKKEQKQQEKEIKKEEKQHEKEVKAAEAEEEKKAKEEERRRKEEEAAGAAGVGAAALTAEEYERRKEKDDEDEKGEGKKKGGLLGIFHRDKKDKDAEDEEPKHKTEKEAATGAGAVGAGTLGKHEYDKHKEEEQTRQKDSQGADTTETEDGKKKGGLLGSLLHRDKKDKEDEDEDKYDKRKKEEEAAVGVGAVGAGAFGKHEYDQRKEEEQLGQKGVQRADTTESDDGKKKGGLLGGLLHRNNKDKDVDDREHEEPKDHRGKEAAVGAGAVGAAALGEHEYEEPKDRQGVTATEGIQPEQGTTVTRNNLGMLQTQKDERAPATQTPPQPIPGDKVYADSLGRLHRETDNTTSADDQQRSRRGEEATAVGAGAVGAGAIGDYEYGKEQAPTEAQAEPQSQTHEHYRHEKTDNDIAAEKRNSIPVVGELHREGRFHGKEGGAPGAVGVPPEERDEAYIESQKHPQEEGEHKKHGILGSLLHRHKDEKHSEDTLGPGDRHRLHKDPPGDHPAANITTDPTTGLPIDTSKGVHDGRGTDGIPHGQHSESLPDNPDVNVQHNLHDPAGMGYGANESGKYNV